MSINKFNYALIMAAGRGLRMMPLTNVIPKAMAPYRGSTIISDGIAKLSQHIDKINITVGYKGGVLSNHVVDLGVSAVFNTAGEGNAWWLYNTLMKYIDEPVLVLTCDNIVELDLDQILKDYIEVFNHPACMLIPVKPVDGLDGDYIFHNNHKVVKLDRNTKSDIYCSGIQVINPFRINNLTIPKSDFYEVWHQLIKRGQLYSAHTYPYRWFAVDTIDQLNRLNVT